MPSKLRSALQIKNWWPLDNSERTPSSRPGPGERGVGLEDEYPSAHRNGWTEDVAQTTHEEIGRALDEGANAEWLGLYDWNTFAESEPTDGVLGGTLKIPYWEFDTNPSTTSGIEEVVSAKPLSVRGGSLVLWWTANESVSGDIVMNIDWGQFQDGDLHSDTTTTSPQILTHDGTPDTLYKTEIDLGSLGDTLLTVIRIWRNYTSGSDNQNVKLRLIGAYVY